MKAQPTDSIAIRLKVVLVLGMWPAAFSAAVFTEQISTSGTSTMEEQATVPGDDAAHGNKSPKTLLEAITRNKHNTGTNEAIESIEPERLDPDRPHLPEATRARSS